MSKKLVSFRLEPELHREIERVAKASGRSVSNLIRRILDEWLTFQRKTQKAPKK